MTRDSLPPQAQAQARALTVNGRRYAWPARPTVVICVDGFDPEYLDAASRAGVVPTMERMRHQGFAATALAVMPTFTNPNNVSIVCGAPPSLHGVSGNYYLDPESGREIMMTDAAPMRAPTILSAFSQAGAVVAAVTAKDKLRLPLGRDLRGIVFSAERAATCTEAENGIADVTGLVGRKQPDPYSADLSLFVLDAGCALLESRRPDLMYLSLSDYVQHKHAPDQQEALDFLAALDLRIARLMAAGAVVGVTADHGMSDMSTADGRPNVLFLGDLLDARFGAGALRVICPITDPFVRHHGALGGFVRIHRMQPGVDLAAVGAFLADLPGIAAAWPRAEACARLDLPADREGDIAVIAREGIALGARTAEHDLSQLAGARLRSHGSLDEQRVPLLLSHPLRAGFPRAADRPWRNFDVFDLALNGAGEA